MVLAHWGLTNRSSCPAKHALLGRSRAGVLFSFCARASHAPADSSACKLGLAKRVSRCLAKEKANESYLVYFSLLHCAHSRIWIHPRAAIVRNIFAAQVDRRRGGFVECGHNVCDVNWISMGTQMGYLGKRACVARLSVGRRTVLSLPAFPQQLLPLGTCGSTLGVSGFCGLRCVQ